jgi:hypothetical protein
MLFSLVLWLLGLGRGVVPGWFAAADMVVKGARLQPDVG